MRTSRWGLNADLLDAAFPFHLVLDEDLTIRQVGASLLRLLPSVAIGEPFGGAFEVTTPKVATTFAGLTSQARAMFLLRPLANTAIRLRGQILHDDSERVLYFVGSPWATDTSSFAALGLSLTDFAVSDPVVDFVLLLQSQSSALADAKKLALQLHNKTDELVHLAFHDSLTGLPNRLQLLDRLEQSIANRRRDASHVAVLMLDLDGFKSVNDNFGHSAGDQLLRIVAQRLRGAARTPDVVARVGGDEFAILLEWSSAKDPGCQAAVGIANRALEAIRAPIHLPSHPDIEVLVTTSIGIGRHTGHETAEELLQDADLAMYEAKSAARNTYHFFEPVMRSAALARIELTEALRRAVANEELLLYYQPIIDCRTRHITAVEATGTIVPLGQWVLSTACAQVRDWHLQRGGEGLQLAVNVSPAQLQPNFPEDVRAVLAATGLDPQWLTLEITESLLSHDNPQAVACLNELARQGVSLSVDDFGTGYSSLSRLQEFPISELKVDKSFVNGVGAQVSSAPLVSSIIALAHGIGLEVVAEGVETEEQLQFLQAQGCERVQGYLLGRPVPAAELGKVLRDSGRPVGVTDPQPRSAEREPRRVPHTVDGGSGVEAGIRLLLQQIETLTGFESAYLTRIDWDAQEQEILYARNTGDLIIAEGHRFDLTQSVCRLMLDGGPSLTAAVTTDYPLATAAADLGLVSYAGVPVRDGNGQTVGTLCAASLHSHPLDQRTTQVMELLAELARDYLPGAARPSRDRSHPQARPGQAH